MPKKIYIVRDWTGKEITYYGGFESSEDAWDAVYERFKDLNEKDFDEQMGEFYVKESK